VPMRRVPASHDRHRRFTRDMIEEIKSNDTGAHASDPGLRPQGDSSRRSLQWWSQIHPPMCFCIETEDDVRLYNEGGVRDRLLAEAEKVKEEGV